MDEPRGQLDKWNKSSAERRGLPNVLWENLLKQRRKGFPDAGGGAAAFQLDRRVTFTAFYVATIRNDVFFRIAQGVDLNVLRTNG